ncbi:hypothetical protein ACIBK1_25555 [Microbispora rosea]|uniref:hypothetical protein n=1 Tax=Microbispora rosea TaxID=58117 RepID=UPI0037B27985
MREGEADGEADGEGDGVGDGVGDAVPPPDDFTTVMEYGGSVIEVADDAVLVPIEVAPLRHCTTEAVPPGEKPE